MTRVVSLERPGDLPMDCDTNLAETANSRASFLPILADETTGGDSRQIGDCAEEHCAQAVELPHLTGVRTFAALWIVCFHMSPKGHESAITAFNTRVNVSVEMFMLLSGFVTQHSYGHRNITGSAGSLTSFYLRRLVRVVLTTQLATVMCIMFQVFGGENVLTLKNLACLMFVKHWVDPRPDCPNGPTWFTSSLLPSWLLYPLLVQPVLARASQVPRRAVALAMVLWLVAIGPQLALMVFRAGWLTDSDVQATLHWPLAMFADFGLGACVAAVSKRPPSRLEAFAGDMAMLLVVVVCLFAPMASPAANWDGPDRLPGPYTGWHQLAPRLAAPLLAFFLYGSSTGASALARFLGHRSLVALGAYTLEVYLFQTPIVDLFLYLKKPVGVWRGLPWSTDVFVLYLLVLWTFSGLFVELLARPATRKLQDATRPPREGI